ncbi:hypothetical protein C4K00_2741 [Pseudomonas synxantha]|nr:hypothetical protein C4K00_2741 [Pseudomonas synxantha]
MVVCEGQLSGEFKGFEDLAFWADLANAAVIR